MPRVRTSKQYGVNLKANTNTKNACSRIATNVPNRIALIIWNTGANPAVLQFGKPVQGDSSDIPIAAGAMLPFQHATTCPVEEFSAGSLAGTTLTILETIQPE